MIQTNNLEPQVKHGQKTKMKWKMNGQMNNKLTLAQVDQTTKQCNKKL